MNWAAMNYVKRLTRESGINGNLRFLFMMIAGRVPKGRVETKPTSLAYYAAATGNDLRTIKNLRDKLLGMNAMALGEKGGGRGRFQTYVIPALQGPLFMVPDGDLKGESLSPFTAEKGESYVHVKGESLTPFTAEKGQSGAKPARTVRTVRTCTSKEMYVLDLLLLKNQ